MTAFKDILEQDMAATFGMDEFSEMHNVNGENMPVVIDRELLKERQIKSAEGTYQGYLLFSVRVSDLGDEPAIGQPLSFDGDNTMRVTDCQEEMGLYVITLGSNMS